MAKRDLAWGPINKVEFGYNASRREKSKEVHESFLTFGGTIAQGAPLSRPIPKEALVGTVSLDLIGIKAMLAYDPTYLLDNGVYTLVADQSPAVQTRNWAVKEDVQVAYAKFDIDSTVGSIPVTGNTGLQVVYTDQSSTGTRVNPADTAHPTNNDGGDKYTYVLPSLNLTFDLSNETFLRFGAARTLARARMDELRASQSFNQNLSNLTSTDPNTPTSAPKAAIPSCGPTSPTASTCRWRSTSVVRPMSRPPPTTRSCRTS
jgi:iron complex outermembrane receptor protein